MLDAMKIFRRQRAALAGTLDGLDALRAEISAKRSEITRTMRAPRPVEDALAAFDAYADAASTLAVDRVGVEYLAQPGNSGGLRLPIVRMPGQAAPDLTDAVETVLGLLLLASRDTIRGVIEGQLRDLAEGRETLAQDAREDRLATLDGELRALEMAEEAMVRQLEAAGLPVSRRPDAPALALLASSASLPG